jgi:putative NIF3 family GTP cyclohydrolase 1 type 2
MNKYVKYMIRAAAAVILCAIPAVAPAQELTARTVIERIKQNMGVTWNDTTVDTFKEGNPDARVTGIAVTMMATLDVLQRAAAAGKNLIITHEPTFYGHADRLDQLEAAHDPVIAAKRAFIKENGLIVWRSHDHWHRRHPDGIQVGMISALGWQAFSNPDSNVVVLPETSLGELAATIKQRLGARSVSVVGDSTMRVTKLALLPGFQGFARHVRALQQADIEVVVIGEGLEWETMPYVADAVSAKMKKALIVVGHIPSEQAGMDEFARWLRTIVPEVPIEMIATVEPFWIVR